MRFKGLDLNLIVALDVLLDEQSVSRSAERLRLSQPATSAALTRLREFFQDDLLVQHGRKMFSTPYGDSMRPHLKDFLRAADTLICAAAVFDPATSDRVFRIIASDYMIVALLAPLSARLSVEAPGVGFEFVPPDQRAATELQGGKADLLISPSEFSLPGQATELLLQERQVVVGCRSNPLFDAALTEEAIFSCGHVTVQLGVARQQTFADNHLARLGKARRIEAIAGDFTTVPWLLMGTRRIAFMHERLARAMADRFDLRFAPIPFDFAVMDEMMQYHHAKSSDEGLIWLRAQIRKQLTLSEPRTALPAS